VPTRHLPAELPIAANKGGGTEPMSEHIAALALAAAKRLFVEHDNLKRGDFNQRSSNKMLRGGVCGILGFLRFRGLLAQADEDDVASQLDDADLVSAARQIRHLYASARHMTAA
jgi:hypothetical protein